MDNLELYNKVRSVPKEARKEIAAGRLKGKTDINPMWRIKTLTEQFGVCGFGWKTEIVREWLETGSGGEITANVEIKLYVKCNDTWSDAIPGIGGSALVAKENGGLHTDDDCYKKAYTDAISVACKALGIGADVYYERDITKYDAPPEQTAQKPKVPPQKPRPYTQDQYVQLQKLGVDLGKVAEYFKVDVKALTFEQVQYVIDKKSKKRAAAQQQAPQPETPPEEAPPEY